MHFRSIADLNQDILGNLQRIPRDIDVVVGVPRSGLVPATLISLYFNLPLADVEGFAAGRLLACGRTKQYEGLQLNHEDARHVLLVDDSVLTGVSIRAAREALIAAAPAMRITTLVVYGETTSGPGADIVLAVVKQPRVFQWNVMHHRVLGETCVDIDGILCVDPTSAENDDGPSYLRFLQTSAPLHRPTRRIYALVTSRLEKYRKETEVWLSTVGVEYERLIMLDLPDARTRREKNVHGTFKADYYRSSNARLFIESDIRQAREIAVQSKKPVLWLPGAEMIYHDGAPPWDPLYVARRRGGISAMRMLARSLVGERMYLRLRGILRPAR